MTAELEIARMKRKEHPYKAPAYDTNLWFLVQDEGASDIAKRLD